MKKNLIVYGCEYIEVEFGQRPMGWKLFVNLEFAQEVTEKDRRNGYGGGSYIGPSLPVEIYEIPFSFLEKDLQKELKKKNSTLTSDQWSPRFRGKVV